ncbi:HlyD family secretion protein [Phormidesmis sp. 146-12]
MQTTTTQEALEPSPSVPVPEKRSIARRFLIAFSFFSIGVGAIAMGGLSIWSRAGQFTIDNAIVNARITRVRAPIPGQFNAVYTTPGMQVKAGQILARIKPNMQQEQSITALQAERQANLAQLTAAEQALAQTQQQIAQLRQTGTTVVAADSAIAAAGVEAKRSDIDEARAAVNQARAVHQRYASLAADGAIAQSVVDEKKLGIDTAEAALKRAEATLQQSQTALNATQSGTQSSASGLSVSDQQAQLGQVIQTQSSLIATLKAQGDRLNQQLSQMQSQFSDKQDFVVSAPFSGVIYSVTSEQSEQVNQLEPVMTILDCQNLWVEGVVTAQQASQINTRQSVQVSLSGESAPLSGTVELMQAVGNTPVPSANSQGTDHLNVTQLQALTPPIKADLAGQALMRVIVRIQPTAKVSQPQEFCGVGQIAQVTFTKKSLSL